MADETLTSAALAVLGANSSSTGHATHTVASSRRSYSGWRCATCKAAPSSPAAVRTSMLTLNGSAGFTLETRNRYRRAQPTRHGEIRLSTRLSAVRELVVPAPIPADRDSGGMYITRELNTRSVRTIGPHTLPPWVKPDHAAEGHDDALSDFVGSITLRCAGPALF